MEVPAPKRLKPDPCKLIRQIPTLMEWAARAVAHSGLRYIESRRTGIMIAEKGARRTEDLWNTWYDKIPDNCLKAILNTRFCNYCKWPMSKEPAIIYQIRDLNEDTLLGNGELYGLQICNWCIWDDVKYQDFFKAFSTALKCIKNDYCLRDPDVLHC